MLKHTYEGTFTIIEKDADNFDNYMAQVGVNIILRKAAKYLPQTVKIYKVSSKCIRIITSSTLRSSDETFILGEERSVLTMDFRRVRSVLNEVDGMLTLDEEWDGKRTNMYQYLTKEGDLVFEMVMNGVKCRRVYKRL